MNKSSTGTNTSRRGRTLHLIVFAAVMLSITLNNQAVRANVMQPATYRVAVAVETSDDAWQAVTFKRPPRRLRARHGTNRGMELIGLSFAVNNARN